MGQPLSIAATVSGTTGTKPRMSARYECNVSACSDGADFAGVVRLRVVERCCRRPCIVILLRRLLLLLLQLVVVVSVTGVQHDVERCRVCA